ncbi:DUF3429 domain-containing protein [Thalassovita sp.]|jgi:hypothetical protein|uniref:DUF3429 domain-containing protein n=1 Tax=Thalassovita sp. TaxID=1979401 RepID=UPI003B5A8D5F
MIQIPRTPLLIGLAGLLPFLWSALTVTFDSLAVWSIQALGARFTGPYIGVFYGAVILAFMSGILWGFATKSDRPLGYLLSVPPAFWAFYSTGGGHVTAALNLAIGFLAILLVDAYFVRHRLAPDWWMALRIPLSIVVVACLLITATS